MLLHTAFYSVRGRGGILNWIHNELFKTQILSGGAAITKDDFEVFEMRHTRIASKDKSQRYEEQQKVAEHMRFVDQSMNNILVWFGSKRRMTLYCQWTKYMQGWVNPKAVKRAKQQQENVLSALLKKYSDKIEHLECIVCKCKIPKSNGAEKQIKLLREHEDGKRHRTKLEAPMPYEHVPKLVETDSSRTY